MISIKGIDVYLLMKDLLFFASFIISESVTLTFGSKKNGIDDTDTFHIHRREVIKFHLSTFRLKMSEPHEKRSFQNTFRGWNDVWNGKARKELVLIPLLCDLRLLTFVLLIALF